MSTATAKVDAGKTQSKAPASSGVTNLNTAPFDPFANNDDIFGEPKEKTSVSKKSHKPQEKIHVRLQQRNGRKTITTVQGIPDKFDARKLLKAMKKDFACNGHVVDSVDSDNEEDSPAPAKKDEHGQILQFQGDQRTAVKDFLLGNGIVASKDAKDVIVVHGY